MVLQIKKLTLENFKGHKKLTLDFDTDETNIYGANGTGKTTIVDAYNWLLFDKDSTGRKDFEIKTLDKNGNTKKDLEHIVEGLFVIDGEELTLRKIYKEKWTRKKGFATDEFTGNVTTYYWNNVPVKKDEFNSKINVLLQDDEMFRILSDIKYFNALTWQRRREILFSLTGVNSVKDEFETKYLTKGKTLDELRREIAASKKKLLSDIDQCPIRIDEVSKNLVEPTDEPTDNDLIQRQISEIDNQLSSRTAANEGYNAKVTKANDLKNELLSKQSKIKDDILKKYRSFIDKIGTDISDFETQIELKRRNLESMGSDIKPLETQINIYNDRLNELRKEYVRINEESFPSKDLSCPTCGQEFGEQKRQELMSRFNTNKSNKLESFVKESGIIKEQIESKSKELDRVHIGRNSLSEEINALVDTINRLKDSLPEVRKRSNEGYIKELNESEYNSITSQINAIDTELNNATNTSVDNTDLINRRKELTVKYYANKEIISNRELYVKQQERIHQIEQERLLLLDKLSENEKIEFEMSQYVQRLISNVENSLSNIFKGVSFKMFDTQINQGLSPTCVVLKDGVPYSDLNTASKIWVSLEIISVLSKLYQMNVPVFIDNRESISDIPKVDSQIINLFVSKSDKKLKIK